MRYKTENMIAGTMKSIILMLILIAAASYIVQAGTVTWDQTPPAFINCTQNQTCIWDFNATSSILLPLNYSMTTIFAEHIDATTGILNFTPTNDQVKSYDVFVIAAELGGPGYDDARINWTILNINDPPNITSHYPENLTNSTEKEGYWIGFGVTADDPDLQFGDVLNYTWLLDDKINKTLLNFTDNIANYTPDYLSAGIHYITINVTDSSNVSATLTWTVNITNQNREPVNNATIPNITLLEDTINESVINLSDYFYDNDTDDYPLQYDFVFVTGQNLTIIINTTEPNNATIIPYPNFFGTNIIRFRCFDGYNYTLSNNVTVNVTGVNDPPVIQQVPDVIAYASTLKEIQVLASDPDNTPPNSGLIYYDNTTLFIINPTTGFISFVPITGQIGNYSIEINVSDGIVNSSMVFNLSIINNTAPVLGGKPLPDIIATEGVYTYLEFNATDIDIDDIITLNTSSSPPNTKFTIIQTDNSASGAKGHIEFTPNQADVDGGPWIVTIAAHDNKGAIDSDTFNITVIDVAHYPQLQPHPIPNQRMKINKTFTLNISATDEDGDLDVFGDNTTLFNITTEGAGGYNKTGRINFTPNDAFFGENWVNITIKDLTNRFNWSLVLFNVTYNTPPTILPIPNQSTMEDSLFTYQINATDPDPQDTLTYFHNATYNGTPMFNISPTGMINFTPTANDTGEHVINITVSDGEANVSTIMNLTIGDYNDFPYWAPPLNIYYINFSNRLNITYWNSTNILNISTNATYWNSTIYEKNYTYVLLDAFDEEYGSTQFGPESTFIFTRLFINFTNVSNDTITSGIDLFDISNYDGDTARINFTPTNSQVGIYYVNITVDDTTQQNGTERINSTTVRLEVFNVNDAPMIVNHSPDVTYYQNMTENSSMMFNITAIDVDYGDSIRYQWVLNGTNITGANKSYYNYSTNFLSAGWRNLTVYVLDTSNTSTMLNWTINVSNINRLGWYGQIRQYNYTHFNAGVLKDNITILPGEQGMTLYLNGSGYRLSGAFESSVLDTGEVSTDSTGENSRSAFTTINWTGNLTPPASTMYNIFFQAKIGETVANVSATPYDPSVMYTLNNAQLVFTNKRYTQYKLSMFTSSALASPTINSVTLGYKIADFKVEQDNSGMIWIYLNTYFSDPDTDDKITYNVTTPNGSIVRGVNITISNVSSRVTLNTVGSAVGLVPVVFHMFDGYNNTDSNIININVTLVQQNIVPIIIPVGGGGGGAVALPVPYEVPKYITAPVSFRLITPTLVTTYANNTMEVPINIFNSNFTMKNLKLKATTSNEDIELKLSKESFDTLQPNQKEFVTLYVKSFKTYGTYDILVEATADAVTTAEDGTEKTSKFNEKAKIFVNSLLKASGNESQVNTKLSFAQDLLSTNPECLELNEFLQKARQMLADKNEKEADKMMEQVIESCKYLIAPKEAVKKIEAPAKVYGMPAESIFILGTVSLVTLIVAIALVIGWAHIRSKRQEFAKKKEQ